MYKIAMPRNRTWVIRKVESYDRVFDQHFLLIITWPGELDWGHWVEELVTYADNINRFEVAGSQTGKLKAIEYYNALAGLDKLSPQGYSISVANLVSKKKLPQLVTYQELESAWLSHQRLYRQVLGDLADDLAGPTFNKDKFQRTLERAFKRVV